MNGFSEMEARDLLKVNFEYSYLHEDWVEPLERALEGLTPEQAAWRPNGEAMGIWDIVLHMAVWNENIVERIETGERAHPLEGAWPPLPDARTEETWEVSKARLWKSIQGLANLIETVSFDLVRASPFGFGDLVCRFSHMAYHSGQIVKLRECQGW